MLRKAKIRTRLAAMATVPIALIAVLAVASYFVVQNLSVNGPAYNRIARSKDLVSEVNNSKLYIVRASLLSHQAVLDPNASRRSGLLLSVDDYRRQYEALYSYWLPRVSDPRVRTNLIASHDAAEKYFELFNKQFRALVLNGEYTKATELLNDQMDVAFLQHESAIESITTNSRLVQQSEEDAAEAQKHRDSRVLAALMLLLALITAVLGFTTWRSITRRLDRLRDVATRELPKTIESVKTAALAGEDLPAFEPVQVGGRDEITETGTAFNSVVGTAVELAADQARTRRATAEMFVNLGRRNHKLLSRTLTYISQLERDERDPATLQNLFKLDHLTTRMRRHAESLLVLAGSAPLRTWSRPVPVSDVLRSALSEIESYDRVDVTSMDEVFLKGAVVSDVAHLLAELLENATTFSPPHTRVRVVGRGNARRYHVIIVDEGIGMTEEDLVAANEMLSHGHEQGVESLGTSRMLGLGVVARLAARHDMLVQLDDSPVGGVVAKITLLAPVLADSEAASLLGVAAEGAEAARAVPAQGTPDAATPAPRQVGATPWAVEASPTGSTTSHAEAPATRPAPDVDVPAATLAPITAPITTALPRRSVERLGAPAEHQSAGEPERQAWAPAADPVIDLRDAPAAAPRTPAAGGIPAAPGTGALRRRVRGAQLPETGQVPASTPPPETVRDAQTVRDALTSFSQGRRGGRAAVGADAPAGPAPTQAPAAGPAPTQTPAPASSPQPTTAPAPAPAPTQAAPAGSTASAVSAAPPVSPPGTGAQPPAEPFAPPTGGSALPRRTSRTGPTAQTGQTSPAPLGHGSGNGHTNGHAHGPASGQSNGTGYANGQSNGSANGRSNGHVTASGGGSAYGAGVPLASAFRFAPDQAPPLRQRIRGAQLPDMSTPAPQAPPPSDRSAETVRAALSSFVAGRRSAQDG